MVRENGYILPTITLYERSEAPLGEMPAVSSVAGQAASGSDGGDLKVVATIGGSFRIMRLLDEQQPQPPLHTPMDIGGPEVKRELGA